MFAASLDATYNLLFSCKNFSYNVRPRLLLHQLAKEPGLGGSTDTLIATPLAFAFLPVHPSGHWLGEGPILLPPPVVAAEIDNFVSWLDFQPPN